MRKLSLDLDDLEIESFDTGAADGAAGTVRAYATTTQPAGDTMADCDPPYTEAPNSCFFGACTMDITCTGSCAQAGC